MLAHVTNQNPHTLEFSCKIAIRNDWEKKDHYLYIVDESVIFWMTRMTSLVVCGWGALIISKNGDKNPKLNDNFKCNCLL